MSSLPKPNNGGVSNNNTGGPRFQNRNLNLNTKPPNSKDKSFVGAQTKGHLAVFQGKGKVGRTVGGAAAPAAAPPPVPVNTASLKRENNGKDPNVNLVPVGNSTVWGSNHASAPDNKSLENPIPEPSLASQGSQSMSKPAPWAKSTAQVKPIGDDVKPSHTLKPQSRSWAEVDSDEEDNIVSKNTPAEQPEKKSTNTSFVQSGFSAREEGNVFNGGSFAGRFQQRETNYDRYPKRNNFTDYQSHGFNEGGDFKNRRQSAGPNHNYSNNRNNFSYNKPGLPNTEGKPNYPNNTRTFNQGRGSGWGTNNSFNNTANRVPSQDEDVVDIRAQKAIEASRYELELLESKRANFSPSNSHNERRSYSNLSADSYSQNSFEQPPVDRGQNDGFAQPSTGAGNWRQRESRPQERANRPYGGRSGYRGEEQGHGGSRFQQDFDSQPVASERSWDRVRKRDDVFDSFSNRRPPNPSSTGGFHQSSAVRPAAPFAPPPGMGHVAHDNSQGFNISKRAPAVGGEAGAASDADQWRVHLPLPPLTSTTSPEVDAASEKPVDPSAALRKAIAVPVHSTAPVDPNKSFASLFPGSQQQSSESESAAPSSTQGPQGDGPTSFPASFPFEAPSKSFHGQYESNIGPKGFAPQRLQQDPTNIGSRPKRLFDHKSDQYVEFDAEEEKKSRPSKGPFTARKFDPERRKGPYKKDDESKDVGEEKWKRMPLGQPVEGSSSDAVDGDKSFRFKGPSAVLKRPNAKGDEKKRFHEGETFESLSFDGDEEGEAASGRLSQEYFEARKEKRTKERAERGPRTKGMLYKRMEDGEYERVLSEEELKIAQAREDAKIDHQSQNKRKDENRMEPSEVQSKKHRKDQVNFTVSSSIPAAVIPPGIVAAPSKPAWLAPSSTLELIGGNKVETVAEEPSAGNEPRQHKAKSGKPDKREERKGGNKKTDQPQQSKGDTWNSEQLVDGFGVLSVRDHGELDIKKTAAEADANEIKAFVPRAGFSGRGNAMNYAMGGNTTEMSGYRSYVQPSAEEQRWGSSYNEEDVETDYLGSASYLVGDQDEVDTRKTHSHPHSHYQPQQGTHTFSFGVLAPSLPDSIAGVAPGLPDSVLEGVIPQQQSREDSEVRGGRRGGRKTTADRGGRGRGRAARGSGRTTLREAFSGKGQGEEDAGKVSVSRGSRGGRGERGVRRERGSTDGDHSGGRREDSGGREKGRGRGRGRGGGRRGPSANAEGDFDA